MRTQTVMRGINGELIIRNGGWILLAMWKLKHSLKYWVGMRMGGRLVCLFKPHVYSGSAEYWTEDGTWHGEHMCGRCGAKTRMHPSEIGSTASRGGWNGWHA